MAVKTITAELASEFSSPEARATDWAEAEQVLTNAQLYWLTTVHADGQPNQTPLVGVWLNPAFIFCTNANERKAKNIAANPRCAVTTGCNVFDESMDIVVEGMALGVTDQATLQRASTAFADKYPEPFHFQVREGGFRNAEGGDALVFRVAPAKAFGFGKGEVFSQTRWRF